MKNLAEIPIHTVFKINGFKHKVIARKLITMGVVPGKEIEIIRKSFFKSTFFIRVQESYFAIRKFEAENIIIE